MNEIIEIIENMRSHAVVLVGNEYDAQDLIQDLYERCINNYESYKQLSKKEMARFIYRILKNMHIDCISKRFSIQSKAKRTCQ